MSNRLDYEDRKKHILERLEEELYYDNITEEDYFYLTDDTLLDDDILDEDYDDFEDLYLDLM